MRFFEDWFLLKNEARNIVEAKKYIDKFFSVILD